jgi:hypothetical protein
MTTARMNLHRPALFRMFWNPPTGGAAVACNATHPHGVYPVSFIHTTISRNVHVNVGKFPLAHPLLHLRLHFTSLQFLKHTFLLTLITFTPLKCWIKHLALSIPYLFRSLHPTLIPAPGHCIRQTTVRWTVNKRTVLSAVYHVCT